MILQPESIIKKPQVDNVIGTNSRETATKKTAIQAHRLRKIKLLPLVIAY